LQIRTPIQVELKVRIASMSRTVTRSLGIDWGALGSSGISVGKFLIAPGSATNTFASSLSGSTPAQIGVQFPGGTFEGVIDALADDNLAHVLAEPTLTTLSGSTASFQSGGELPVPSAQSLGTTSITFVNYGVILQFKPVVLSDDKIELTVEPQLSQLDAANSVTVDGTTEPSINITEASSTIVLGSGQGMAIAGLLEDNSNETDNAVPGLGEVPVLGALFRGDSFAREQQELVITVTPYLVNPVSDTGVLASPDDGWSPPNDLQRILLLHDSGTTAANTTIPGDAGFMVQ
jgi:pilus assembly protein CpaC